MAERAVLVVLSGRPVCDTVPWPLPPRLPARGVIVRPAVPKPFAWWSGWLDAHVLDGSTLEEWVAVGLLRLWRERRAEAAADPELAVRSRDPGVALAAARRVPPPRSLPPGVALVFADALQVGGADA